MFITTLIASIAISGFNLHEGGKDTTEFKADLTADEFKFSFTVDESTLVEQKELKKEFDAAFQDRVEVYIAPVGDRSKTYFAMEIDSNAHILDYRVDPVNKFNFDWNFKTAKAKRLPHQGGYAIEGRISRAELEALGIDFSDYYLAVFRADVRTPFDCPRKDWLPVHWYTGVPVPPGPPDFHKAEHFFHCRGNERVNSK